MDIKEYKAVHYQINKDFGKANKCEFCKLNNLNYCWANRDGKYLKDRGNWLELCYSCHKKYDNKRLGWKPWNAGVSSGKWTKEYWREYHHHYYLIKLKAKRAKKL